MAADASEGAGALQPGGGERERFGVAADLVVADRVHDRSAELLAEVGGQRGVDDLGGAAFGAPPFGQGVGEGCLAAPVCPFQADDHRLPPGSSVSHAVALWAAASSRPCSSAPARAAETSPALNAAPAPKRTFGLVERGVVR